MKHKQIEFIVNGKIYTKNLVIRTIDLLSNEFIVELSKEKDDFKIKITPKYNKKIKTQQIKNIFIDHLNNQIIRNTIFNETSDIRNMIVGKALFETEAFDNDSQHFNLNKYKAEDNYMIDKSNIAITRK